MPNRFGGFPFPLSGLILATVGVSACGDGGTGAGTFSGGDLTTLCLELQGEVISGAQKDGIPSSTETELRHALATPRKQASMGA